MAEAVADAVAGAWGMGSSHPPDLISVSAGPPLSMPGAGGLDRLHSSSWKVPCCPQEPSCTASLRLTYTAQQPHTIVDMYLCPAGKANSGA